MTEQGGRPFPENEEQPKASAGAWPDARPSGWKLWSAQSLALLRIELRKNLFSLRSLPVYLLALMPIVLFGWRALFFLITGRTASLGQASTHYAVFFQTFFLRFAVFFGCVGIFTNLFRGELLNRTLHFYLLTPVRREVLAVGKFISGLATVFIVFGSSAVVSYLLMMLPSGPDNLMQLLSQGPWFSHLLAYLLVTVLAGLGYGAVFLVMGLFFRNPIVPAALVLGWESINFLLPPVLKRISVIHYLQSLSPVTLPQGFLALMSEPTSAWLSVPGLLLLTALVLYIAARRARKLEIQYSE